MSIDDALKSEQWMIILFALMDKRLGKRRLIRLKEVINSYPVMLQKVYKIRMKEEGFKEYEMFNM